MDVVYVVDPDTPESERRRARRIVEDAADTFAESVTVSGEVLEADDVVEAIVERSGDYDLMVIGATREGLLQQFVFGAIPEEVGRRAKSTVIMTKRHLGIRSRLNRWFRSARRR